MDVSEYPEELWREAERRAAVIAQLAQFPVCSQLSVVGAAAELGLSGRQVYELIKRYRRHASTSSLVPGRSSGGRGKPRTNADQENLVSQVVMEVFCSKQRPSVAAAYREVLRRAQKMGLTPPSTVTLWRRTRKLDAGALSKREQSPWRWVSTGFTHPQSDETRMEVTSIPLQVRCTGKLLAGWSGCKGHITAQVDDFSPLLSSVGYGDLVRAFEPT